MTIYEFEQLNMNKKNDLPEAWRYKLEKETVLSVHRSFINDFPEYENLICSIMKTDHLNWDKDSLIQIFKKVRKLNWWKIMVNAPMDKMLFAFAWYVGELYIKCYGMKWTVHYVEPKSKNEIILSNSVYPVMSFDQIIIHKAGEKIIIDDFIPMHYHLIDFCNSALRQNSLERIFHSFIYFNANFDDLLKMGYVYPSELRNQFLNK